MNSNPFVLISTLISAIFAFFTVAFVIEILMKIFSIKQHRARSTLRLLPFASLIVDLAFSQYSIAHWINPLSCSSCVQKFILEIFYPELKTYLSQNQISLIKHLGNSHAHSLFGIILKMIEILSFTFAIFKLSQAVVLWDSLRVIKRSSIVSERRIDSISLRDKLEKRAIEICVSNEITVPLTLYPNIIYIPHDIYNTLSQKEFEAVIAHEWEHLKYRDPLTRLLCHVVAAFFWWVPTNSWMRKIEQDQELACDQNVKKYGVSSDSIASALLKVVKQVKVQQTICCFSDSENFTLARVQTILGLKKNPTSMTWLSFAIVASGIILLFLCMTFTD